MRRVAKRFGLRQVNDDEEWTVYWTDTSVLLERVMEMKRYQVEKGLHHLSQKIYIDSHDVMTRKGNPVG